MSKQAYETVACVLNDIVSDWSNKGQYKENGEWKALKKTKENIACIYLGVAIHLESDAFAHKSYYKKDGDWKALEKKYEDNPKKYEGRFQAAKIAVNYTLHDFIKDKKVTPDNFLFWKKIGTKSYKAPNDYGGDRMECFRIHELQRLANYIDLKYDKKFQYYSYGD